MKYGMQFGKTSVLLYVDFRSVRLQKDNIKFLFKCWAKNDSLKQGQSDEVHRMCTNGDKATVPLLLLLLNEMLYLLTLV